MLIGYARVSSYEQNLDLQVDALKKDGCEKIFTDKMTGIKEARNGLDDSLAYMRAGDTLVVWRLDRLGLTLKQSRMAKDLYVDKNNSVSEICQMFQVSKATLYRYMKTVPEAM